MPIDVALAITTLFLTVAALGMALRTREPTLIEMGFLGVIIAIALLVGVTF